MHADAFVQTQEMLSLNCDNVQKIKKEHAKGRGIPACDPSNDVTPSNDARRANLYRLVRSLIQITAVKRSVINHTLTAQNVYYIRNGIGSRAHASTTIPFKEYPLTTGAASTSHIARVSTCPFANANS